MNMGLALAMLGLTTFAVALLMVPLIVRNRRNETRDAYNLAVYRDQLAEIERDVGRGLLSADEAAAAKSEIGRRILALTPGAGAAATASSSTPLAVAAVAIVMLPFAAWTLYWQLGSPGVADQPFAARSAPAAGGETAAAAANTNSAANPHLNMAEAIAKLKARLQEHPDDLGNWMLLARAEIGQGRYADAVDAYRHAAELSGQKPEIVGDWAEAEVLAAGGKVTPEAQQHFTTALAEAENAPRSRYYLALAKLQAGDQKTALQQWVDLEADSPDDANWLPMLRKRIDETARTAGLDPAALKTSAGAVRKPPPAAATGASPPAPQVSVPAAPAGAGTAADEGGEQDMPSSTEVTAAARAAAGASPQERQAMIDQMVARLAARLEQQPDDAEGWVRLGRSYMVLNQPAKAKDAYARAARLKPDDTAVKQQYAEAIIEAEGGDQPPAEATALMRQILGAEPQNAEALWYVGLAEAAAGHKDKAQDLFTKLLAQLPADAPARLEVEQRLAALKGEPAK
ncbi:MAG: c-type cytochrome biogenesis protein CcmI [Alphaproteobacteria bacterium]|nr:c-type cytochrome biogenesis protein CcmI [Alphaproteobacteria bacterium]